MKKKIIFGIIVLVIITGVILGLTVFKDGKNGLVKYRTEKIAKGDLEAVVTTSGTVNPITMVEVGSQVSGKIANLYVDFNSKVTQGQILAELDLSTFQTRVNQNQANYMSALASLEKAKVTLDNLQKQYERALRLFEKELISFEERDISEANYLGAKTDLQRAEASVDQAKSQLESSKLDLSYAIIRSPIDGIVISRNMNVGQTVQASFTAPKIFEIANDLSKMQVECDVDEADVGRIQEAQKVRFTVDAFPNDSFNGIVQQVRYSPTVTQNVVTYTTIVAVDNPGMKLRPGMTATVNIIIGEAKDVLRVPNAALRFTPTLPAEELAKIMKEAGEKMMAQRKAQGGQEPSAQTPGSGSGQPPAQGAAGSGARMTFSQGGGMPGQGAGTRTRRPSMVWYLDENQKLNIAFIRPGVTDNSYTEILRSDLKEGQEVIIGLQSGQTASSQSGPSPQRMMFVGR
ncbi:MAG: efflux RND transporter periplasmic adaptor subunit [Candidatus Aminicenantes bacterium]|nr:efflux RND transporter periplasmic adaptor subunit [Candidatus Aminicenantes bacterium]